MAAHHVGEKTDAESRRLREDSEYLDHLHDREGELQEQRNVRPEDILPIMLRTEDIGDYKSHESKDKCDGDIAGKVRTAGEYHDQSHKVHRQDEEETCEQIWRESTRILSERTFDRVIIYERHEKLHEPQTLARGTEATTVIVSH